MSDDAMALSPMRGPTRADEAVMLALNNAHAVELSPLTPRALRQLLHAAFRVRLLGAVDAFLVAFDQDAPYESPNFIWFRSRYPQFVYIDRVVVAAAARGKGLARTLYEDLFSAARNAGHRMLCCEVNIDPPNPASDRFHAALCFTEVGRAALDDRGKTVRYLVRHI